MAATHEGSYGGFWIRALAIFTDSAILTVVGIAIMAASAFLGETGLTIGTVVLFLAFLLYFPVMQSSARQATVGKGLLGLKVAHAGTGERISFLRAFGRELGKIVSGAVFCIGYIIAAFTGRKQALHDLIASTVVVREGEARVVLALVITIVGFVLPVIAAPMLLGAALLSSLAGMASFDIVQTTQPSPMKAAAKAPAAAPVPAGKVGPRPAASPSAPAAPASPVASAAAPAQAPAQAAAPAPAPMPSPSAAMVAAAPATIPPSASMPSVKESPAGPGSPGAGKEAAKADAPAPEAKLPEPEPRKVPDAYTPWAAVRLTGPSFSPKYNDLMTAVRSGDREGVEELLAHGWWPDKRDSRGRTPLIEAALQGDTRMVEALLKAGADPEASGDGQSAAAIARRRSDPEMLSVLRKYGAR
ncbi:MAG TPA: RDD family protein [Usitatibacteraceae bacterium]|nr:RDD family protein [Usitatibacteraceae bacterium]